MKINIRMFCLLLCLSFSACSIEGDKYSADIVITNANIWTGNPDLSWAEAIAIKEDKILAVGSNLEIETQIGTETLVIDAEGKMITPGFIDTHVHFLGGGFNLLSIKLRDAATPEEFINRFVEYTKSVPAGSWIQGGTWDHELWGGTLPERSWIDSVTQDHPVAVSRLDGHMILANSKALELAGISNEVKDIDGGTIVRTAEGEVSGIFKDNAMGLIYSQIPEKTEEEKMAAMKTAMKYMASNGVTTLHDVGNGLWPNLDIYRKMEQQGEMLTRIYKITPLNQWQRLRDEIDKNGPGSDWLKLGGLKGMVDGSLGSHTAAFFEPFTDAPDDKGFFIIPIDSFYHWTKDADNAGLQVAIHAIGDSAIHQLLNVYQKVEEENGDKDRRFRIEHSQHLLETDIPRFAELKVIPSMQPYHAIDDGRWAERVIGDRIKTTYAFRSLIDAGATVAFGSDWTVAPATPLEGIYAAVTRRTIDGQHIEGWVPEQRITVEEALTAYTINAAYAGFDDLKMGSLEPGKLADLVILDRNITTISPGDINNTKVEMTIVGGKVVYQR